MATVRWKSGTDGDWSSPDRWTGGVTPRAGDNVVIKASGTYTVTISDAEAARTLTLANSAATVVDRGSLTLSGGLTVAAGTFQLASGGAIVGGTLSAAPGGHFAWNGGILNGVTYDGVLDMSAANSALTFVGGGTFAGTGGVGRGGIDLTGAGAALYVGDLDLENATLTIGRTGSRDTLFMIGARHSVTSLTLGADVVVAHAGGEATIAGTGYPTAIMVNDGSITAAAAGGDLTLGSDQFTNNGAITVSQGDSMHIRSTLFANSAAGTITASGEGTMLYLETASGSMNDWSNAGTFDFGAGAQVYVTGPVGGGGAWSSRGLLQVDPGATVHFTGAATLGGVLSGGGVLALDRGAYLDVETAAGSALSVAFSGPGETLALGAPASFAAAIAGFAAMETIDLLGITATSATLKGGKTLVVSNGGTVIATLKLAESHAGDTFDVTADGRGGTAITIHPVAARFAERMASLGGGAAPLSAMGADAGPFHGPPRLPTLAAARGAALG